MGTFLAGEKVLFWFSQRLYAFGRGYMNIFGRGYMHFAEAICKNCRGYMRFAEAICHFAEAICSFCENIDQLSYETNPQTVLLYKSRNRSKTDNLDLVHSTA